MKTITQAAIAAAFAAAGAIALTALPAAAQETDEVRFAFRLDRELAATPEGAKAVYRDLRNRARKACRNPDSRSLTWRATDPDCEADLIDSVVAASDAPMLAEHHARQIGEARPVIVQQAPIPVRPDS